jgi:hypothetical protein
MSIAWASGLTLVAISLRSSRFGDALHNARGRWGRCTSCRAVDLASRVLDVLIYFLCAHQTLRRASDAYRHAIAGSLHRNYRLADLPIVGSLAAASAVNAITIFALYINSPTMQELYRRPEVLWMICPVPLYWFGRALVMAHRRFIDEDPMSFVLRDRISLLAGGLIVAIMLLAI